ncbi:MAG: L-rhamnose mutarotase [Microvirga sp.]
MMPGTETTAFAIRLREGCEAEYRRRHDALWPEMRAALLASGILHYEIYLEPGTRILFGHIVRRTDHTMTASPRDPVLLRWRAFMADILEMEGDAPSRLPLRRMFRLDADDQA